MNISCFVSLKLFTSYVDRQNKVFSDGLNACGLQLWPSYFERLVPVTVPCCAHLNQFDQIASIILEWDHEPLWAPDDAGVYLNINAALNQGDNYSNFKWWLKK